jgi:DNA-binding phage protein
MKKKGGITVPMKTYTDRILTYFAKLSGITQICKKGGIQRTEHYRTEENKV